MQNCEVGTLEVSWQNVASFAGPFSLNGPGNEARQNDAQVLLYNMCSGLGKGVTWDFRSKWNFCIHMLVHPLYFLKHNGRTNSSII